MHLSVGRFSVDPCRVLATVVVIGLLAGCGQKGPLYLRDNPPPGIRIPKPPAPKPIPYPPDPPGAAERD